MKERPILFNGPMARALLDGSKTQTRRAINPQPERCERGGFVTTDRKGMRWAHGLGFDEAGTRRNFLYKCPYGQPGDRLWVRESWYQRGVWTLPGWPDADADDAYWAGSRAVEYAADGENPGEGWRSRPSIHMPYWASRILLEIVSVRVERLNDIGEADARAEGVTIEERHKIGYCAGEFLPPSIRAFRDLWESINGAGSWDANPWVWVVEFKRVAP